VADDRGSTPAPRPRRRRTDIDPNAPSPPVANERRRRSSASPPSAVPPAASRAEAGRAEAAPDGPSWPTADTGDPTITFHVPGLAVDSRAEAVDTSAPAGRAGEPDLRRGDDSLIGAAPADAPDGSSWLQVLDDRSPDPSVCPFLRAAGGQGLVAPIEMPHPANRCAALAEAVPQSLRQQELVCLTTGHVNCPRYLRGTAVVAEEPEPVVRTGRALTPAVLGSLFVLVMAVSASIAFVLARGGPSLAGLVPSSSPTGIAIDSPLAGESLAPSPLTSGSGDPGTSIGSASPSVTPSPSPSSTPTPRRTSTAAPTSDRFALLTACPDTSNCWIYRIRRGDNLYSIAHYFGVSLDSIYKLNPWVKTTGLRAGRELRIPTPTR
jgi:LysM repeat protein